jgi:hypothetical protein
MATWQVEVRYGTGGSWVDITDKVLLKTMRRVMSIHNDLKPTANTLEFEIERDTTIISNLLTEDDIYIRVHKDTVDWFTGNLRHNFTVRSAHTVKPVRIECVDYAERLKKRATFTDAWVNYQLSNTSNTAQSIVHALLDEQGDGIVLNVSDDGNVVPYLVNVDGIDDRTYWEILEGVLFEYGYTFNFNESGEFEMVELFPTSVTATDTFDDDNVRDELTIQKRLEAYDGVEVRWWALKTATGALIFKDTTGGDASNEMNVSLDNGDSYPETSGTNPVYADYQYNDSDIVYVTNASLSYSPSTLTETTFANRYQRAEVQLDNATGSTKTLTQFRITGDVTYRYQMNIRRSEDYLTKDDRLSIEAQYIATSTLADKLCTGVKRYHEYGNFEYEIRSEDEIAIGTFVSVQNTNLGINNTCRVLNRVDRLRNNDTDIYRYNLLGAAAYVDETTSESVGHSGTGTPLDDSAITGSDISGGEIIVAASTYPGSVPVSKQCDGTADEVEINEAIDELIASDGGGKVKLTRGTFNLAGPIDLQGNVILEGDGSNTIINCASDDSYLNLSGIDGAQVSKMAVLRPATPASIYPLIEVVNCNDIWLTELTVSDSHIAGIDARAANNLTIRNCIVRECDEDGILVGVPEIDGGESTTTVFRRDTGGGDASTTFTAERDGGDSVLDLSRDIIVSESYVQNNGGDGVDLRAINAMVINCYLMSNTGDGLISVGDEGTIQGNIANENGGDGIEITGDNCSVNSCRMKANTGAGLRTSGDRAMISGCIANDNDTGYLIEAEADSTILTGNSATGNTTANRTDGGTNTQESGNLFT